MSDTVTKPLPHPDSLSQPYWDGAAEGKLRLQRCAACGAVRHYPQLVCSHCYSLKTEAFDASGRGTVHSWTVAHHAFHPAFKGELPYTLLIVDLPEGPRVMGRLVPAWAGALRLGLKVRVSFPRNEAGTPLPVWTPEA
jgi:uncharacterized OB-fold protein